MTETVIAKRPANTQDGTYPTTCWECSTCCGALATVRDGRVVRIRSPIRDHPHSKGAFCIKGIRGAPGITYGASRLLHPMRRTGARGEGRWARISWDEALDEMADRLAPGARRSTGRRRSSALPAAPTSAAASSWPWLCARSALPTG